MTTKYPAPRPPQVPAFNHGGPQTPTLLVMHSTVSGAAKGTANGIAQWWHKSSSPNTSAHYIVDEGTTIQCVGDHTIAYHCGYNTNSIGIEMCDDPSDPKSRWDSEPHIQMLNRTADLVAQLCLAYGIPARYLTDDELRAWGRNKTAANGGIVTHAQMSRVFKMSTHWDPGEWPSEKFLETVRADINEKKSAVPPSKNPLANATPLQKRAAAAIAALTVFVAGVFGIAKATDDHGPQVHPIVGSSRTVDVVVWNEKSFPPMSSAKYASDFSKGFKLGGKQTVWLHSEISRPSQIAIYKTIAQKNGLKTYGVFAGGRSDTTITARGLNDLKATRIQISNKQQGPVSPIRWSTLAATAKSPAVTFISLHLTNGCFPGLKNKPYYESRCKSRDAQVALVKRFIKKLNRLGSAVIVGGDLNLARTIQWGPNQKVAKDRLMQMAVIPASGMTVSLSNVHTIGGYYTDHRLLMGRVRITVK